MSGPYTRATVKTAHMLMPIGCMATGWLLGGYSGIVVAAITLMVTHVTSYNDRASWDGG